MGHILAIELPADGGTSSGAWRELVLMQQLSESLGERVVQVCSYRERSEQLQLPGVTAYALAGSIFFFRGLMPMDLQLTQTHCYHSIKPQCSR